MDIIWGKKAKVSYTEELEFILVKWNLKEVKKFTLLVNSKLEVLKTGKLEGRISKRSQIRSVVVSKQTTLFFDINKKENRIELLLFWNNKRDPKELKKVLQNL